MKLRIPSANELARSIQKAREKKPNYPQNPDKRLGTVESTYTRSDPKLPVIFDGEDTAVTLPTTVEASPNARVTVERFSNQWVVTGVIGDFDWTNVSNVSSFGTGWSNYGGGWESTRFRKNPAGEVILEGMLRNTIVGTNANMFFTLPVGFRPQFPRLYVIASNTARRIIINTDGTVGPYGDTTFANNDFISLSGVRFLAGL